MKNPFGLKDGKLVTVQNVERGLTCGCVCPACKEPLQAHKGSKKIHYFKHYNGSDCGYGLETGAHLYAKSVIETEKILLLPSLKAPPNWESLEYLKTQYKDAAPYPHDIMFKELVPAWYKLKIDEVLLEQRIGNIIPDVIAIAKGKELLVEIKVTHGVDEQKEEFARENKLAMVEYDFSKLKDSFDKELLKRVLTVSYKGATRGRGLGRWVYHPKLAIARAEVTLRMKQHYPKFK
ncbi:MAG: hypothetical protein WAW61_08150 [Methylococcaceae bacterium]